MTVQANELQLDLLLLVSRRGGRIASWEETICRADLQLLLSHKGETDEGQQLLHLIKVSVKLLRPSHARCEETALRARLQSITFMLSQVANCRLCMLPLLNLLHC